MFFDALAGVTTSHELIPLQFAFHSFFATMSDTMFVLLGLIVPFLISETLMYGIDPDRISCDGLP